MKIKETIKDYNIEELYFVLTHNAHRIPASHLNSLLDTYDKKIRLRYLKNKFPDIEDVEKYSNLV